MDGQNFENENNVTIDTTAAETVSEAEVTPAAEPVQETPVVEPVNNYQDYTANVQPQTIVEAPKAENKETNVLAIVSLVLGILSIVLGCCTGWVGALFGVGGIICAVFATSRVRPDCKGRTDLLYRRYRAGNSDHDSCSSIFRCNDRQRCIWYILKKAAWKTISI